MNLKMQDQRKMKEYKKMVMKARAVQSRQVMPLIGPLLDAWDDLDNDTKGVLKESSPLLCQYLAKLDDAMCVDIGDGS